MGVAFLLFTSAVELTTLSIRLTGTWASSKPKDYKFEFVIQISQQRWFTHSLCRTYLPQSLRSSSGAPAGGVLTLLSMQGIALRYS